MILHFYLRFHTSYGQRLLLLGNAPEMGSDSSTEAISLTYFNSEFWHLTLSIDERRTGKLLYKYILSQPEGYLIPEVGKDREIDLDLLSQEEVIIEDTWNAPSDITNVFLTQPFCEVLFPDERTSKAIKNRKSVSLEFRVQAPLLNEDIVICLTGSHDLLKNWNEEEPLLLNKVDDYWTIKLKADKIPAGTVYKYGLFNKKENRFLKFEKGVNRVLNFPVNASAYHILSDGFARLDYPEWKGAGVAIPVFSLRSSKGFGTGEFTDIRLLVDWALKSGIRLIQLLPINDSTSTHTWKDSYPYSAISAFALHPLYLNLDKVAGKEHQSIIRPLKRKQQQLNEKKEIDYEQVMKFKWLAAKELFLLKKEELFNDNDYFEFFELNRHWLLPYAAFCYLRDKYKTADFSQWKNHHEYNEAAIQRLVSPGHVHYDDIVFFYFIQYHLHQQLKDATVYAHKQGIILKGDIPIGIGHNSVDAWTYPGLYNMDEQAGAPPDDFAVKGQNWGFPTYNWKKMQEDDFAWWRKRFEQMSICFDAFRIDHILGFFRIWSIPSHAVEGIMGRFRPAIPVHINEFSRAGISFDVHRFCHPFINEEVLQRLFGKEAEKVKEDFLEGNNLKEGLTTQREIQAFLEINQGYSEQVCNGLMDLCSNVILFQDEADQEYHFRFGIENTLSFKYLHSHEQAILRDLYTDYFYKRQDAFWKKEGLQKLPGLKGSTQMLVCGEDLGMVPHCVPEVMQQLGILSLEIQRMPKKSNTEFFHPHDAPYMSVVTPSTHDMSTLRGWWEEDRAKTQRYYNTVMGRQGNAPYYCEPWVNREIVLQHLYSPAMWSIFQLQDLMGMSNTIRRENPHEERINIPSNPEHYWNYRMHISLEELLKEHEFAEEIREAVVSSGR